MIIWLYLMITVKYVIDSTISVYFREISLDSLISLDSDLKEPRAQIHPL